MTTTPFERSKDWSFERANRTSRHSTPPTFSDVIVPFPYGETLAQHFLCPRRRRSGDHPQRRSRVLGLPARASTHGRDRARTFAGGSVGDDLVSTYAQEVPWALRAPSRNASSPFATSSRPTSTNGDDLGASVAVYHHGELVCDLWGGFARPRTDDDPGQRDTIVNVWSTTKTMTFLVMLMLIDRGELDVDAPVAKYWPEFAAEGKGEIEVRHLMNHTSGLAGFSPAIEVAELGDWDRCVSDLATRRRGGATARARAITRSPRDILLGEVVRRITGDVDWPLLCRRGRERPRTPTSSSDCPSPKSRA